MVPTRARMMHDAVLLLVMIFGEIMMCDVVFICVGKVQVCCL